jgi:hypothetical protein
VPLWPVHILRSQMCICITATLRAAILLNSRLVISCTDMKRLSYVREPDAIGSINYKGRIGNYIFMIFSHLEA